MTAGQIIRDLYQSTRRTPWPLRKPVVIQFPVNDICNSHCRMCNIWRREQDHQITLAELQMVLKSSLFSEVRSVGINGGEPTLRKDLHKLVEVMFRSLPKLRVISMITNALDSHEVNIQIQKVGEVVQSHRGLLDVMVSLDGIGHVHDRVRGCRGNFENALKVIEFVSASKAVSSHRLGCTVIKDNVHGIHDVLDFAIRKNIYVKFRLGILHRRLYNQDMVDRFALSFEEKVHFGVFLENLLCTYERSETQKYFYRSLIGQLLLNRPRQAGCRWQHQGVTISSRCELLYCAVESDVLGSAVQEDSQALYFGNQKHLRDILNNRCVDCAHDYVGLLSVSLQMKMYLMKAAEKFRIPLKSMRDHAWLRPIRELHRRFCFETRMRDLGCDRLEPSAPITRFRKRSNHQEPKHILICGWYGTETLGDKAILGGIVNSLRDALGDFSLYVASLEPYVTRLTVRQMPELKGTIVYAVEEAIRRVKEMDLVLFGGGPLMAIDSIIEMLAIFQEANSQGVPIVISGCGVGPLGSRYHNRSIKQLLELASFRIYRDEMSLEYAASLGIDTNDDLVAEDPSFTWLSRRKERKKGGDDSRLRLILGLRDWPYYQYAPDFTSNKAKALRGRFERHILGALEELVRDHENLRIIPYPMCTNHRGGDDRWYYRKLFRDRPKLCQAVDYSTLARELAPDEAVAYFQEADVALTMRFHSLIFAVATNTPAIAIDYTLGRGKISSFCESWEVIFERLDSVDKDFIVSNVEDMMSLGVKGSKNMKHFTPTFSDKVNLIIEQLNRID